MWPELEKFHHFPYLQWSEHALIVMKKQHEANSCFLWFLQEMQENVKKCKNFLATLIKLASHNSPSPETSRNVKALVQDLLVNIQFTISFVSFLVDLLIDAENYCFDLNSSFGCNEWGWASSKCNSLYVIYIKKSLKDRLSFGF